MKRIFLSSQFCRTIDKRRYFMSDFLSWILPS